MHGRKKLLLVKVTGGEVIMRRTAKRGKITADISSRPSLRLTVDIIILCRHCYPPLGPGPSISVSCSVLGFAPWLPRGCPEATYTSHCRYPLERPFRPVTTITVCNHGKLPLLSICRGIGPRDQTPHIYANTTCVPFEASVRA